MLHKLIDKCLIFVAIKISPKSLATFWLIIELLSRYRYSIELLDLSPTIRFFQLSSTKSQSMRVNLFRCTENPRNYCKAMQSPFNCSLLKFIYLKLVKYDVFKNLCSWWKAIGLNDKFYWWMSLFFALLSEGTNCHALLNLLCDKFSYYKLGHIPTTPSLWDKSSILSEEFFR